MIKFNLFVLTALFIFSGVISGYADNVTTNDTTDNLVYQAELELSSGGNNIEKAESLLQQAARQGSEEAHLILGRIYTRHKKKKDYANANFWLKKAADQGSTKAMEMLALIYVDGRVIAPDYSKAAYWLQRGSAAGDLDATYNLSDFYMQGTGVAKDRAEAIRLLKYAAEKGHQYSIDYFVEQAKNNDAEAITFLSTLPMDSKPTAAGQ